MFPGIDRVYVNARARADLEWRPRYDFGHVERLGVGRHNLLDFRSIIQTMTCVGMTLG